MSLFSRKKPVEISPEILNQQLEACREGMDALKRISRSMVFFLKEFPLDDIPEIDTDEFKSRMDLISEQISEFRQASTVLKTFSDHKLFILDFIAREKDYIQQKETELKNIIEMLRTGLSGLIGDSRDFNSRLYDQNVRMEALTHLDDIRKIKESLQTEVSALKQIIQEKQNSDSNRIDSLSKEITILKTNLEQVKDASQLDPLTGAFNRLTLDSRMQWQIQRNQVVWQPVSLMMCDLDNFKSINDTHGHLIGDRVLKCFVQECRNMFRSDDLIARYGGEEFVVLLPGIPLKKALKRAQSFCKLLSGKQFVIEPSRPNERIAFTVSIGISELRREDTMDTFIGRADKALYKAKHTGKNRAVGEKEA